MKRTPLLSKRQYERLMAKTEPLDKHCRLWTGQFDCHGYPIIWLPSHQAHYQVRKLVLTYKVGCELPAGAKTRTRCLRRNCVSSYCLHFGSLSQHNHMLPGNKVRYV